MDCSQPLTKTPLRHQYKEIPAQRAFTTVTDVGTQMPDHLQNLWRNSTKKLSPPEQTAVAELLIKYQDVFSRGDYDIGKTNLVKHSIDTGTSVPIKQRPRRAPGANRDEINKQVEELLEKKLIEPSSSPWASPVVLVSKKDGTKRFCIELCT